MLRIGACHAHVPARHPAHACKAGGAIQDIRHSANDLGKYKGRYWNTEPITRYNWVMQGHIMTGIMAKLRRGCRLEVR